MNFKDEKIQELYDWLESQAKCRGDSEWDTAFKLAYGAVRQYLASNFEWTVGTEEKEN